VRRLPVPDEYGHIDAVELAGMTAHEFRRWFPKIDRARRLMRMSWSEYRYNVLLEMGYYGSCIVTTDSTEAVYA
jgi:hypothetical protein